MKNNIKNDRYKKTIKRQIDEIQKLKATISELEIDCKKRNELIESIDSIRNDLIETVNILKEKVNESNKLIFELRQMRKVVNQEVFKGRWSLIKHLIK